MSFFCCHVIRRSGFEFSMQEADAEVKGEDPILGAKKSHGNQRQF